MAKIEIYQDNQDPSNPGWAYRSYDENGMHASGELRTLAAKTVRHIVEGLEWPERGAAELSRVIGYEPGDSVTLLPREGNAPVTGLEEILEPHTA